MARKVIITCAVTGSADTVARNPAVPVTPDEIAQSALDAARAGAAIVHVHVRDPESGKASMELDHYRETTGRIRQSETDVVLNLTTGYGARLSPGVEDPFDYGPGTTFTAPTRRIAHVGELRPEICSLDVATMNSGGVRDDSVMINSPPQLRYMADSMREWGVVPELEVFDVGGVRLAANLIEKGHVPEPGFFQLCLGIEWGAPATPEALSYMKRERSRLNARKNNRLAVRLLYSFPNHFRRTSQRTAPASRPAHWRRTSQRVPRLLPASMLPHSPHVQSVNSLSWECGTRRHRAPCRSAATRRATKPGAGGLDMKPAPGFPRDVMGRHLA